MSSISPMTLSNPNPFPLDPPRAENWLKMALSSWADHKRSENHSKEVCSRILDFVRDSQAHTLDLSDLSLTSLPDVFNMHGNFERLKNLNLSENRLKTLPHSISTLKALEILYLGRNSFEACLLGLQSLSRLRTLDLHMNQLKALPTDFGGLTNLHLLSLSHNDLEGLPGSIRSLFFLDKLMLGFNPLKMLPEEIFLLPKRCIIEIEGNDLPSEFITGLKAKVSAEGYEGPIFDL